jgi:hypothetical protein
MKEKVQSLSEITVEDIIESPKKYGLPTLSEFILNSDKYIGKKDGILAQASNSSQMGLRKYITKQVYWVDHYKCYTEEEAEKVLLQQGYDLREVDMEGKLVPTSSNTCEVHIRFVKKQGNTGDASVIC